MKKSVTMTAVACACACALAFGLAGCGSSSANNANTNANTNNTNSAAAASVSTTTTTSNTNANTNSDAGTTTTTTTVVTVDEDEDTITYTEYKSVTSTDIDAGAEGSIEYTISQASSDGVTSLSYDKFVELMEGTIDMDVTLKDVRTAMGCNGTLMTSSKYPSNTYAWYTADKQDCVLCTFDGTSDSSKCIAFETTVE